MCRIDRKLLISILVMRIRCNTADECPFVLCRLLPVLRHRPFDRARRTGIAVSRANPLLGVVQVFGGALDH